MSSSGGGGNGRSPARRFSRSRQGRGSSSLSPAASAGRRNRSATPIRGRLGREDVGAVDTTRKQSKSRSFWRSESRTVRGSIDEEQVGGEEEEGGGTSPTKKRVSSGDDNHDSNRHQQQQNGSSGKDVEKGQGASTEQEKPRKPAYARILPTPLPHFLGYRKDEQDVDPKYRGEKPYPSIIPAVHYLPRMLECLVWIFIGSFIGIGLVCVIFARPYHFTSSTNIPSHPWMSPVIIGSFGASSVILFGSPESPLGQPRVFVGGQFLSALAGVCVTKLFRLSSNHNLNLTDTDQSLVWVAGSTAVAFALILMMSTGTLHPPGGATAVLCATNSQVERLGWKVLPVVLLTSAVMLVWTMIWMNLGRRKYPQSWVSGVPANPEQGNVLQGVIKYYQDKKSKQQEQKTGQ